MSIVTSFETDFKASAAGVQRLEVIPAGGRRRWTPEAKARIIAESFEPGANMSEVARRHGIVPQQLYSWRRKVGERMEAGERPAFVPAVVEEPVQARPAASSAPACGQIVIELRGMTVRVPDGVSADHIERVLLAVQVAS